MKIAIGKRTVVAKTCLLCGLLKSADQFVTVMKYYRDSYCKSCHNVHGRPNMHRHQEKALDAAVKHGQPWDEDDIDKLLKMVEEGYTGPAMALELSRSVYSVYTMKSKLAKEDA